MKFVKREYDNLMELQDCTNVVHLYQGCERQVSRNDLNVDLLFEYCPYSLKQVILDRQINFRLSEIKSFLRQILLGLQEIHSKSVSLAHQMHASIAIVVFTVYPISFFEFFLA